MTQAELLSALNKLRDILVSVATGGAQINAVNEEYGDLHILVTNELVRRSVSEKIPYSDLWQWYGRWKSGDLPSYASRRVYVAELFAPILTRVRSSGGPAPEPTGWSRVDRIVGTIREDLAAARDEERFQAVGLMCREVLISLGQEVFDSKRHPSPDGVTTSTTDFKRMIEAYISVELQGSAKDELRKHARSALDLAVRLQHQRTATFRDAAVCVEATTSVVSIIAILCGRRDISGSQEER